MAATCFVAGSSTMPPGQIHSLTKAWDPMSEVANPSPLVRYLGGWNPSVGPRWRPGWLVGSPVLKEQKRFGVLNKKWVKTVNLGWNFGAFFFSKQNCFDYILWFWWILGKIWLDGKNGRSAVQPRRGCRKKSRKDMEVQVETGIVTGCDFGLRLRSNSLSRFDSAEDVIR